SLSYDLSSVSVAQRGKVIVAWYNDPQTSSYDHGVVGDLAYNIPRDYTIQANAAPGGGAAPASSWVTLVTVTGNGYHSREHLVDLTGYNWIRISVTASDGRSGNTNAVLNLDVHDASLGVGDSSIFFGDSIAMDALHHEPINGTGNYSQLVSAARPGFYPAYEDGGTGGIGSLDGATHIGAWLNAFPGRYVGIALGTNDANGCGDTTAFYNNYVAMVQAVLGAGKVPIVPTIPWARTANIQSCGPAFNAKIQALYTAFPQVDKGPDLWAYYQANQSLISSDDLHPTTAGYAAYRQQWVNTMLATYYGGGGPAPAVTLTPASLAFASQVVGSTSTSQTSTLKNTGTASLTITSVGLTGANPGDFTQANDCPASLAANATCTITVAFRPTATGSRSASVAITDNAVGSPHNVTLTGTGTASSVTLTPASLAFGSLAIGSTSAPQTSTLQNTGTAPLTVSGIALTGTNPGDFTQANDCPASLAVSATCTITVSFKPTATGSRSAIRDRNDERRRVDRVRQEPRREDGQRGRNDDGAHHERRGGHGITRVRVRRLERRRPDAHVGHGRRADLDGRRAEPGRQQRPRGDRVCRCSARARIGHGSHRDLLGLGHAWADRGRLLHRSQRRRVPRRDR
ncbi:MAG: choice-of-anchor D domain-containing protein, partial [Chloroflexi bacterium]